MSEEEEPRRRRWVVAVLVILPAWLFVSAGLGLWKYYADSKKGEIIEPSKFASPIEADQLADDMRKLVEVVGPREIGSEAGARGLRRAAAMIQGALGPANAGYRIEAEAGIPTPAGDWPVLVATLPGGDEAPLGVIVGYDAPGEDPRSASSSVASVMAVARALAGESPERPLSFVFIPHLLDPEAPIEALLDKSVPLLGEPELVLVVGSMAQGGELVVSSSEPAVLARPEFPKYAEMAGVEESRPQGAIDLATNLNERGLLSVGVTTVGPAAGEGPTSTGYDEAAHLKASRKLAGLVSELIGLTPQAD